MQSALTRMQPASTSMSRHACSVAPSALPRAHAPRLTPSGKGLRRGTWLLVRATEDMQPEIDPDQSAEQKTLKMAMKKIMGPLGNYGMGQNQAKEGVTGFVAIGGSLLGATLLVMSGAAGMLNRTRGYTCVAEFPQACGISVGTPVRVRGVQVGSVVSIRPTLERVDAVLDIANEANVIPRNSKIQANQSGLIMEPLIDITPQIPLPTFTHGPNDPRCDAEGAIVCARQHITGEQGVSIDDLVYVGTRIARQIDMDGFDKMLDTADIARQAIADASPLLRYAAQLAQELVPMVEELQSGTLLQSVESLSATAAGAAKDLAVLAGEVMTVDNTEALKESIRTVTETLKHVESISGDVSRVSGDKAVHQNIKQLIEQLSKLLAET